MPEVTSPFQSTSPIGAALGNLLQAFSAGGATMEDRQAKAAQAEYLAAKKREAEVAAAQHQNALNASGVFADAFRRALGPAQPDPNFVGPVTPEYPAPTMSREAQVNAALPDIAGSMFAGGRPQDIGSVFRALIANAPSMGAPAIDRAMLGAGGDYAHTITGFGADQQRRVDAANQQDAAARRGQDVQAETTRRGQDVQARTQETIDNRNVTVVVNPDGTFKYVLKRDAPGQPAPPPPGAMPLDKKPLPAAALKMQQEELDAIGTASSINADLAQFQQQIDDGRLQLGVFDNMINRTRNALSQSNEQSNNLASFETTMERLRNESLRLNKGVQTEGDAIRAWNELFQNINDQKWVRKRLEEIQKINARAVELRKMNIDQIRANYGHGPLDTSGYTGVSAAVGGGGGDPLAAEAYSAIKAGANEAAVKQRYREKTGKDLP